MNNHINCLHMYYCLIIWLLCHSKDLGAVESAKKHKCTPKQALHCKEFSALYWELMQLGNMAIHLSLLPFLHLNGYSNRFDIIFFSECTGRYIIKLFFYMLFNTRQHILDFVKQFWRKLVAFNLCQGHQHLSS